MLVVLQSADRSFSREEILERAGGKHFLTNNAASELRALGFNVVKSTEPGPDGETLYLYQLKPGLPAESAGAANAAGSAGSPALSVDSDVALPQAGAVHPDWGQRRPPLASSTSNRCEARTRADDAGSAGPEALPAVSVSRLEELLDKSGWEVIPGGLDYHPELSDAELDALIEAELLEEQQRPLFLEVA